MKKIFVLALTLFQSASFALGFFALLILSKHLDLPLARYDFLFIGAVALQGILLLLRWETLRELQAIIIFHLLGMALELYKTSAWIGSWSYPEEGLFKLLWVPLYSGFMYAAVGSFILQLFKRFALGLVQAPPLWLGMLLALLIYMNFFTHHIWVDLRWWLLATVMIVYCCTQLRGEWQGVVFQLPLLLVFGVLGFAIWLAENFSTFYGAWVYPNQQDRWQWVHLGKISSWMLLVILSFLLVVWQERHQRLADISVKQ
jgi:uncharacterized membrane protein YoaT (DUF817 family)